jgi:serine/threonine protein kinase
MAPSDKKHEHCCRKGIDHLVKCSGNAFSDDRPTLSRDDARMLTEKMKCASYLGGGTFGTAFETVSGDVVKFIPQRNSKGHLPCDATHEFKMHRRFARKDLAWRPHGIRNFTLSPQDQEGSENASTRISAISMPKVDSTLDRLLQNGGAPQSETRAASLGAALARLVRDSLAAGLVHHDAKCNNIGISDDGEVRFIDFGRAFDEDTLRQMGASRRRAERAVRLGAAIDAWRFQDSVTRRLLRSCGESYCARLKEAIVGPLRSVSLKLLMEEKVFPTDFAPDASWWEDEKVFETLKGTFSDHLRCALPKR